MIQLAEGLKNSLIVLEHLRSNEELAKEKIYIAVGTFTNSRECGLTFKVMEKGKSFTWCVYEHRNSDDLIINGKKGYISSNGELPYITDSKNDYLAEFGYNQHAECADKLTKLILEWYEENGN
jgi:hypothetical protein